MKMKYLTNRPDWNAVCKPSTITPSNPLSFTTLIKLELLHWVLKSEDWFNSTKRIGGEMVEMYMKNGTETEIRCQTYPIQ